MKPIEEVLENIHNIMGNTWNVKRLCLITRLANCPILNPAMLEHAAVPREHTLHAMVGQEQGVIRLPAGNR